MIGPLRKPAHGRPCTGCGLCCMTEACPVAEAWLGPHEGPCRALRVDADGKAYHCGILAEPEAFAPARVQVHGRAYVQAAVALMLGVGKGCDAIFDGDDRDEEWEAWAFGLSPAAERVKPLAMIIVFGALP